MTLLEAVKKYPNRFIHTLECRASTTPNQDNKNNHLRFINAIILKDYEFISVLIVDRFYTRALCGVIACLNMIDYDEEFTPKEHSALIKLVGAY